MDVDIRSFMWLFFSLGSVLLTNVSCMFSLWDHTRHIGNNVVYPDEFLNHLGYMDDGHGYWMHTRKERKEAIKFYQRENGLAETGKIDRATWALMKVPRCAVPDIGVIEPGTPPERLNRKYAYKRKKRAVRRRNVTNRAVETGQPGQYKWTVPHLKYRPSRLGYTIPFDKQKAIFREAFRRWSLPANLLVTETYGEPDIDINFQRREHGDGRGNAFDGKGMLLAHAFMPGDLSISGDIHFDADEHWTHGINNSETRDLMMIAMHEVGHALGMMHSRDRNDIMFPAYLDYNPDPQLNRGDLIKFQQLYGSKPGYRLPKSKRKQKKYNNKKRKFRLNRKLPKYCRRKFNAVVLGPDKVGYIFVRKQVYKVGNNGVLPGYPVHVGHEFRGAPINPALVFYVYEVQKWYFFKGYRMWRFSKNHKLDEGYPKISTYNSFKRPKAVLTMKDTRGRTTILFLSKKYQWRWNYRTERNTGRYHLIKNFWRGLPEGVDSAVEWSDQYIYFFQYNKYYKFSKYRKVLMKGYPQYKGSAWLGGACGSDPK